MTENPGDKRLLKITEMGNVLITYRLSDKVKQFGQILGDWAALSPAEATKRIKEEFGNVTRAGANMVVSFVGEFSIVTDFLGEARGFPFFAKTSEKDRLPLALRTQKPASQPHG